MEKILGKIWVWIKHHTKVVLFFIGVLLFVILILWWGHRNKKIVELRNKILILESKLKLEKLSMKYNINLSEIVKIKDDEKLVELEINKIKRELEIQLDGSMSADEITDAFKKIGVKF